MTSAPISYADAADAQSRISFILKAAGPSAFDMTAQAYAKMCSEAQAIAELLRAIVDHRKAKEGRA